MRVPPWLIAVTVAVGATAWIASGVLTGDDPPAEQAEAPAGTAAEDTERETVPSVRVRQLTIASMDETLTLQGRTQPDRMAVILAENDGRIDALLVDEGDRVSAGDLLARIEPRDREAALREANAALAQAELEYNQSARLNASGYRADTDVRIAEAALERARAGVERAEIALTQLEIRAPFDGVIDAVDVEHGDLVAVGDPVATLLDLDPLKIVGQVNERSLGRIAYGSLAEIATLDGRSFTGIVSFIGSRADETTRTFPVEVEITDEDHTLIANMTAQMDIPLGARDGHLISPAVLSLAEDGTIGVKIVDDEDIVTFVPIDILADTPDGMWVAGLPDNARLITVGQEFVMPGQPVQPVPEDTIETGETS